MKNEELSSEDTFVSEALSFWDCVLSGPVPCILQEENQPQLKAACCECLSSIGSSLLDALPVSYTHLPVRASLPRPPCLPD